MHILTNQISHKEFAELDVYDFFNSINNQGAKSGGIRRHSYSSEK